LGHENSKNNYQNAEGEKADMRFTIGFEKEDTKKLHKYWDEIFENQHWSEGKFTSLFKKNGALITMRMR